MWAFFSCGVQGLLSSYGARASHCGGCSCYGAWALGCWGLSSCNCLSLEYRLSSCGAGAQLLYNMWDLHRLGIEPVSPALASRFFFFFFFLPLGLQGSPNMTFLNLFFYWCLLKNLYAVQEATVRTGHGTTDWFQIGKGERQGCILSPCLFNLYAGYIMRNSGLEEAQTGIKIAGRNINNLRYADDITLWQKVKRN